MPKFDRPQPVTAHFGSNKAFSALVLSSDRRYRKTRFYVVGEHFGTNFYYWNTPLQQMWLSEAEPNLIHETIAAKLGIRL